MTIYAICEIALSKVTIKVAQSTNYYKVDSEGLIHIIYDTAMKHVDPLEMDDKVMGEKMSFARRYGPKVPTLRGNFNLTVEDETEWDSNKFIRMCFQIYNKDKSDREMVRFINM